MTVEDAPDLGEIEWVEPDPEEPETIKKFLDQQILKERILVLDPACPRNQYYMRKRIIRDYQNIRKRLFGEEKPREEWME